MTLTTHRLNGGIVLEASGRLVAGGPERELQGEVRRAIDAGCRRLTIVLSGVSMIDAAGIGAIASAVALTRERCVRLVLVDPSPRVAKLLSLTGLIQRDLRSGSVYHARAQFALQPVGCQPHSERVC